MNRKTISKGVFEGREYVLIDANDGSPPIALECQGMTADCLLWNIYRMAHVEYKGKPRELDPAKVIARLDGRLPPGADVSKD
jgi:hypothetical protein